MTDSIPRLRMFAGPNGSGKTTVKIGLQRPDEWFGIYINADDLKQTEIEDGTRIKLKSDRIPNWFQSVWDQF